MNVLVLCQLLVETAVNMMRLVRIHTPSVAEFKILLFKLTPGVLLDHKLPSNLVPSLLPVNSGVQNQDGHLVNSGVHSNEAEPTLFHHP